MYASSTLVCDSISIPFVNPLKIEFDEVLATDNLSDFSQDQLTHPGKIKATKLRIMECSWTQVRFSRFPGTLL